MLLNEKFNFSRPLTVTGVIFYKTKSEPDFHQMTLDRIENDEYVLANSQFSTNSKAGMVLLLQVTNGYFFGEKFK